MSETTAGTGTETGTETAYDLATMTWEEVEAAYDRADLVILPCGSHEQHSTHLPVSVDSLRADHLTAELVTSAENHELEIYRLPTLSYGFSEHHMQFPGTVTLSEQTYIETIIDIGHSLSEHDVDRLLLLNCHGGNKDSLSIAADRLQRDHDLTTHFIHWTAYATDLLEEQFGDQWGHAGEHETSFVELYRPDLVVEAKKEPQTVSEMPQTRPYTYFDDITKQGGLGDPTESDSAYMETVVERATDRILQAIADDIATGW